MRRVILISSSRFSYITDESSRPKSSSILFIPGVESSRLYTKSGNVEHQLWEPGFFSNQGDVKALDLHSDGTSINQVYTKKDAAIDTEGSYLFGGITIHSDNIYKSFLQQLAALRASSTISDFKVFPYDWRMSPEDVVAHGTAYDDGTHYLDQELIALADGSQTGKVTIVAHSNGGLVAKALMIKLAAAGKANLVDKIILIDVPQLGTPKAIAVMLHGDFQQIPESGLSGFIASQATARGLSENMPDAFNLLPSAAYFASVATPVVDFSNDPDLKLKAGIARSFISGQVDLKKFMTGFGGRAKPDSSDIETPNVISSVQFDTATAIHANLDSWTPPAGVSVIQIAGWGIDTPSGIAYSEISVPNCSFVITCFFATSTRHTVTMTEDGDGTVVIPSQVATTSWTTYFLNLSKYRTDTHQSFNHADITEFPILQRLLSFLIASSSSQSLADYVTATKPNAALNEKSLRLRVLSPVTLDLYDNLGNHTGMARNPNPQSDDLYVEEQIPGSYYQQYGEGQYIGVPADQNYHVILHGKDTGTFTFEATPVSAGIAGTSTVFADVPVTASSTASVDIQGARPALASLALDFNGDGIVDITIASSTQTIDPLAYAKLIKVGIAQMDIGNPVQKQLQAKIANIIYLLSKLDQWIDDDDDGRDDNKSDRMSVRALRKLNKIEVWIQKEVGKPVSKKIKDERITSSQAEAIIGMIEELKLLVNSKL